MEKEKKSESESKKSFDKFLKENWPYLSLAATLGGAALFLTLRYISRRQHLEVTLEEQVDILSQDSLETTDETAAILENGSYAVQLLGKEEVSRAAYDLAQRTEDPKISEALLTISNMADPTHPH